MMMITEPIAFAGVARCVALSAATRSAASTPVAG
jgi:hypothetical protein